jgi:hypothetical protein
MDAMSETSIGSLSVKDGVAEFRFAGAKFTSIHFCPFHTEEEEPIS